MFYWTDFDTRFNQFRAAGVAIRGIRVVDAPAWIVRSDCLDLLQRALVDFCPPRANMDWYTRAFGRALAQHYGPASPFGIDRVAFWNEPNLSDNWGDPPRWDSPEARANAARQYSDRLGAFSFGVEEGDGPAEDVMNVDAGEIAAGSAEADKNANGVGPWASEFTRYNYAQGHDRWYEVLVIHAYSEFGRQIPEKVLNHRQLPGVSAVGVGEFAWGAGGSQQNNYRCAGSEGIQASRFAGAIDSIRTSSVPIHHLVHFSVLDNRRAAASKCPTPYYDVANSAGNEVRKYMNSFGLYRRSRDGTTTGFDPETMARPLRDEFRAAMR